MNNSKRVKTNPKGEKINGSNLLSKYVSKNMILIYSSKIDYKDSKICLFNRLYLYKSAQRSLLIGFRIIDIAYKSKGQHYLNLRLSSPQKKCHLI